MNYYSKDLQKDLVIFDPALLQTQLDTLEEPDVNEAIAIDIALTPEQIIEQVIQKLGVTDSVCRGKFI